MPESLRSRLIVQYGEALATRICARFFDTSDEELYSRLAVILVPFQADQTGLALFGLRPDGGWTDLTPGGLPPYDPTEDSLWIEQDQPGKIPRLLMDWGDRGDHDILLRYEAADQLYQALSDQPRWQGD